MRLIYILFRGLSLILIMLFLSTGVALAASYQFDAGTNNSHTKPQVVISPEKVSYLYGVLTPGQEKIDFYALPFSAYTRGVTVELLVSEKDQTFAPSLIYTDPAQSQFIGEAPFTFPVSLGGRVFSWDKNTETKVADSAVGETFRLGPHFTTDMSEKRYLISVFDPAGKGGRYVLKIGAKDEPRGLFEWFEFLISWIRIKLNIY